MFASETSWRRLQDMSSRRLTRGLENVFKTSSRRLQDVFKTFSRRLGRRKIVTLKTCWRRLQDMSWRRLRDVLKTNKCLLGDNFAYRYFHSNTVFEYYIFYSIIFWSRFDFECFAFHRMFGNTYLLCSCWHSLHRS